MFVNRECFEENNGDTTIAGLYDLGRTIGKGHYAVVKLARHVFTGEKVAVKVIDKTKLDKLSSEHLFQEVVCMKLVQHPNVVRLYEVIDTANKLYLILELGDGGDLYDYIMKHENGLSEKLAKRYFRQIVTAIAYCHNLHVVHRDLKPENVVFFEQLGVVKLTDFGFSNQFVPGKLLETACGSLAYSAPEILLGYSYDAAKVDIWSLGVILFMLVCGRLPFEEANDSETLSKIMDCEYKLPAHLSAGCCRLISQLLIKDPSKRAQLDEILQDDWLRLMNEELPISLFSVPLISQEHLSFEDHMEILDKMASGGLASIDEIQTALDNNAYNHISATYFILAERKLKRNYIEEYKHLSAQAKAIEEAYMHKTPATTSIPTQESKLFTLQPSTTALPKSISASLAVSGAEERLRRFSMILEDEEEDEKDDLTSSFHFPLSITEQKLAEEFVINDTLDKALLDEEEEELEAVASLACVRSEFLEHDFLPKGQLEFRSACLESTNSRQFPKHTLLLSRNNTSTTNLYERAVSESSLTTFNSSNSRYDPSTSVNQLTRTVNSSSNSLTATKMCRWSTKSVRPLFTVKSSPQLLKNIAENDWENISHASDELSKAKVQCLVHITRDENLYLPNGYIDLPNQIKLQQQTRKSMSTIYTKCKSSSMPRTKSPPWNRKCISISVPNNSTSSSRPGSGITYCAPFIPSLPVFPDRKRRSSVSVTSPIALPPAPVNIINYPRHISNTASNGYPRLATVLQNRDRRRSGPPGVSLVANNFPPFVESNSNNNAANICQLCTMATSFSSNSSVCNLERELNSDMNGHVRRVSLLSQGASTIPEETLSTIPLQQCEVIREIHPQHHFNCFCKSAPCILDQTCHTQPIGPGSSTVEFASVIINPSLIREMCAPIREEEDEYKISQNNEIVEEELSGSFNASHPLNIDVRRQSEIIAPQLGHSLNQDSHSSTKSFLSSGLETHKHNFINSQITGNNSSLYRFSTGWQSTIRSPRPNELSSRLTASNISLISLVSSLRESPNMMNIIRGTLELRFNSKNRKVISSNLDDVLISESNNLFTKLSMVRNIKHTANKMPYSYSNSANASLRLNRGYPYQPQIRQQQLNTSHKSNSNSYPTKHAPSDKEENAPNVDALSHENSCQLQNSNQVHLLNCHTPVSNIKYKNSLDYTNSNASSESIPTNDKFHFSVNSSRISNCSNRSKNADASNLSINNDASFIVKKYSKKQQSLPINGTSSPSKSRTRVFSKSKSETFSMFICPSKRTVETLDQISLTQTAPKNFRNRHKRMCCNIS